MGLETAEYITQLVSNWPLATDKRREGDDHLRLIKQVLKNTFPNLDGPVTATPEQLNGIPAGLDSIAVEIIKHLVPKRVVMAFAGTEEQVPVGWALCDGRTVDGFGAVPDLRGKFIIAASTQYAAGTSGGATSVATSVNGSHSHTTQEVALSLNQMPAHAHKLWVQGGSGDGSGTTNRFETAAQDIVIAGENDTGATKKYLQSNSASKQLVENTGAGQGHSHGVNSAGDHTHSVAVLPPYYSLAYIIKTSEYAAP